jgi:small subunit ribosomal protein S2
MQNKNQMNKINDPLVEEMFEAGVHYGYLKSRRHPSILKFIHSTKNKNDIINLDKTAEMLKEAKEYIATLEGKVVLLVGTKPEAKKAVKELAEELELPYVTERWIGGTLTNFGEIKKRVSELEKYQKGLQTGELEKYTKKERLVMAKKNEKLERYYSGLLSMKKLPDALFVIDTKKEKIACAEAKDMHTPIIGIVNSDSNLKHIDHPVVGNDSSTSSIKFFVKEFKQAYKK